MLNTSGNSFDNTIDNSSSNHTTHNNIIMSGMNNIIHSGSSSTLHNNNNNKQLEQVYSLWRGTLYSPLLILFIFLVLNFHNINTQINNTHKI